MVVLVEEIGNGGLSGGEWEMEDLVEVSGRCMTSWRRVEDGGPSRGDWEMEDFVEESGIWGT